MTTAIKKTKHCALCGKRRLFSFFTFNKRTGAYSSYCKPCAYIKSLAWIALNPEKHRVINTRAKTNHRRKYPDRERARYVVTLAIATGKLTPQPCEVCQTRNKIHAHHDNYSEPLKVRWFCRDHHRELHRGLIPSKPINPDTGEPLVVEDKAN